MILQKTVQCPSFFLTNARSILPKFDDLRLSSMTLHADVLIVTESWLHNDIDSDLLHLPDYKFFRCDRKQRKGGGVCIWSKTIFRPLALATVSSVGPCFETSFVRLACGALHVICCGIYIPPGLTKSDHDSVNNFLIFEIDHLLSLLS